MNKFLAAFALFAVFAAPAQAGILGSVISNDGIVDTLTDDSRAFHVDNDAAGLSVGDELFGWIQITSTTASGAINPPGLVGIFSATITGGTGGVATPWTLGATAGVNSLTSLAPSLTAASGGSAAELAKSIFVLGGRPTAFNAGALSGGAGIAGAKAELTIIDSAMGFEALIGLDGVDDFFNAFSVGINLIEDGGFTVFKSSIGTGPAVFLPLTGTLGGTHDALLNGIVFNSADTPWKFQDNTNFFINTVPEPASMAVWGLLAGFAGVSRLRRKN